MKSLGIIGAAAIFGWLAGVPAAGHDCGHHAHAYDGCWDCGHYGYRGLQSGTGAAPSARTANLQTVEGKVAEIIYLPGVTAESGMVEIRVQAAGPARLIRLAPAGFLKQRGLQLREGDAVVLQGFPVAAMEGDLIVATEVRTHATTLSLRDTLGRPAW